MMSWQAWRPPAGWPDSAPPVRWQSLPLTGGHEAVLWLFQLDDPAWDSSRLTACLSEEEMTRAGRFRHPLHARRHRVTHAVVRHLLAQLNGQPAASLVWQTGPHGKPHLAMTPHFNLSHSGGWALLATSFTRELGVDLEGLGAREHMRDMSARILSEAEQQAWTPNSDMLLRTWTRKEACLKALGTGLNREMNTLTLGAGDARTAPASLATHGPLPPLGWTDITLPDDCAAWGACAWLG